MSSTYEKQYEERQSLIKDIMWEIYLDPKKSFEYNLLSQVKEKENDLVQILKSYEKQELSEKDSFLKTLIIRYMPDIFEMLIKEFLRSRIDLNKGINNYSFDSLFNELSFIALPKILKSHNIKNVVESYEFLDLLVINSLNEYYMKLMTESFQDEHIIASNSSLDILTTSEACKIKRLEYDVALDLFEQRSKK